MTSLKPDRPIHPAKVTIRSVRFSALRHSGDLECQRLVRKAERVTKAALLMTR